jgi:hypothetical protein
MHELLALREVKKELVIVSAPTRVCAGAQYELFAKWPSPTRQNGVRGVAASGAYLARHATIIAEFSQEASLP